MRTRRRGLCDRRSQKPSAPRKDFIIGYPYKQSSPPIDSAIPKQVLDQRSHVSGTFDYLR